MVENAEDTAGKLSVNMDKFRNEVDSVNRLLMAQNESLTEQRDNLQIHVDRLKERVESRPIF